MLVQAPPLKTGASTFDSLDLLFSEAQTVKHQKESVVHAAAAFPLRIVGACSTRAREKSGAASA